MTNGTCGVFSRVSCRVDQVRSVRPDLLGAGIENEHAPEREPCNPGRTLRCFHSFGDPPHAVLELWSFSAAQSFSIDPSDTDPDRAHMILGRGRRRASITM